MTQEQANEIAESIHHDPDFRNRSMLCVEEFLFKNFPELYDEDGDSSDTLDFICDRIEQFRRSELAVAMEEAERQCDICFLG